ncbi:MAG: peptidoglycan-binding protein [Candidatus Vogelbacteria bacterium]|nr:peptidoglycan-binding protein [Candidatus Vogelbacteria bacterium]
MVKSVKFGIFAHAIILWCLFAGFVVSARAEELAISEEFTGQSEPVSESQFTTRPAPETLSGTVSPLLTVSEEFSFRTATATRTRPVGSLAISDELMLKTLDEPVNSPPDNNGNGGGGGGGGNGSGGGGSSGGGFFQPSPAPGVVEGCPIYLTKFIKFGATNDPTEVRKLQIFLRDYEGFNSLAITGIYDQATLAAVMIFQTRYRDAILKPWGIDYPTGYVYITTSLAINNLYCERDPVNDLDFRIRRGEFKLSPIATSTATTTLPLPEVGVRDQNLWQLAALGLLDFIRNHLWLWFLFLIVLILLLVFWPSKKKDDLA